jgi:hypothetical protein
MQDFIAVLRASREQLAAVLPEAVQEACDDLLSESRDEVPVDQMDLSNSGKVTVVSGATVEGAVSYDTPYAVIQHEATDFAHQDGRKAHYLSDPLRANGQRYLDHIARRSGDAIGGG